MIQLNIDTISLSKNILTNISEYIQNQNTNNTNLKLKLVGTYDENYRIQRLITSKTPNIYKISEGKTYLEDNLNNLFVENLNTQKEIETKDGLKYNCNEYFIGADSLESKSTIYYKDDLLIQENTITFYQGKIYQRKELSAIIKN